MSIHKLLLHLYPRLWRRRYEDEMLALLEVRPLSLSDSVDMLLGAIDAHLHPQFGTRDIALSERIMLMLRTVRASLLTLFCAYIGFVVAGIGFQKMTEYDDFVEAAHSHTLIGTSYTLVVIGSAVALLAILVAGLPIAFAIVKSAFVTRRIGPVLLLAVPLLAFALLSVTPPLIGQLPIIADRIIFVTVFLGLAVISTFAVCMAIARGQVPDKLLRFAVLPSVIATVAMALMLVSTVIWGIGLQRDVPQLFGGNDGIMASSTAGTWLGIVIGMALTTIVAVFALVRGLRSRSVSYISA